MCNNDNRLIVFTYFYENKDQTNKFAFGQNRWLINNKRFEHNLQFLIFYLGNILFTNNRNLRECLAYIKCIIIIIITMFSSVAVI